jgi:hypothetical protein
MRNRRCYGVELLLLSHAGARRRGSQAIGAVCHRSARATSAMTSTARSATAPPKPLAGLVAPPPTTAAPPSNIRLPNVYGGGQSSEYPAKGEASGSSPLHNRAAAAALGVTHTTIQNDLANNLPQNGKDIARAREGKREAIVAKNEELAAMATASTVG